MLWLLKQPWFTSITSLVIFWPLLCGITPLECGMLELVLRWSWILTRFFVGGTLDTFVCCFYLSIWVRLLGPLVALFVWAELWRVMSGLSFLACFYCPATADWLSKMCQTNFNCVYLLIQVQLANNIVGLVYLKWIFFYGWFFSRGLRNGLQQRQRLSRCFVLRNGLFYSCVLWPDSRSKRSRPWRRQDSGKEERLDVGIWTERKGEMIINSSVQSKQDCRAKHNRDGPFYLKQMAVQQALRHPNFPLLTVARIATAKMSAHGQHRPGRYECHDLLVWASMGWDVIKDFFFFC